MKKENKTEIKEIKSVPPKASAAGTGRKRMKDYVKSKARVETLILKDVKKVEIDKKIIQYLEIKAELKALDKRKAVLEGELDSNTLEQLNHKLLGQSYSYEIKVQSYDMVISKDDAIKGGVWAEFVSRGFTKLASRKQRIIGPIK